MFDKNRSDINDTEKKILSAAETEFMNKGFAGARTTTIAEAAGVTHAMLHYYFRTKEKLFEKIISEKMRALKEILTLSIEDISLPLEEFIMNLISRHLEFISSNPDLPRFLISEVYSNSQRASFFIERITTMAPVLIVGLQRKIDNAVEQGCCRQVDAVMLVLDIISLNIFPYMVSPIVNAAFGNCMEDGAEFLEKRKKENFNTIMAKLRPNHIVK